MSLIKIYFENFTAFKRLNIDFSKGINVFIGPNGTGKTHILKAAYAACDITKTQKSFAEKLVKVFLPYKGWPGRLVHRQKGSSQCSIQIYRQLENDNKIKIEASFSNHVKNHNNISVKGYKKWIEHKLESVYIPVKEMLSNAPGLRSLYSQRELFVEEIYIDILDKAYLPALKGPIDRKRKRLLKIISKAIDGKVIEENEHFFLSNRQGKLEFPLLAEGLCKLGLLWLLIQNGTLLKRSVLFWDEPEANLNPKIIRIVVEILLELQRMGVQIFLATHDYVVLKEFDLQRKKKDEIKFHSLYRDEKTGEIKVYSTETYFDIHPNAIAETFADLYDRTIEKAINQEKENAGTRGRINI